MGQQEVKSRKKHRLAAAVLAWVVAGVAVIFVGRAIQAGSLSTAGSDFVPTKPPPMPPALTVNDPKAFPGYTLVGNLRTPYTYLIDLQGRVVHIWNSPLSMGVDAHLLANGNLLHSARLPGEELVFSGPGDGGRVQEITWEGQLIWDFKFHNAKKLQHHAITPLPNGHILIIAWEPKSPEETIAAGRRPELAKEPWLSDSIVEIEPSGRKGARVVWEWHAWDHIVQDYDRGKPNFGNVRDHPELVDINFRDTWHTAGSPAIPSVQQPDQLARLRSLGYVGNKPTAAGNRGTLDDWLHINATAYNAGLDQIMMSVRGFDEIWIIDHSTSSKEAAGHTGGRSGRGGDLLYRWGNPHAYRAGTTKDQQLFGQHDAHWIDKGLPGEGHVLLFNNGPNRLDYSSVDEIVLPPADERGRYAWPAGQACGPERPIWSYSEPAHFLAALMSSAQRLPNGNTFVCSGEQAILFEVTPAKKVVWQYASRVSPAPGMMAPNGIFRAHRYGGNYAGLSGKALVPGKTVEEIYLTTGPSN
jgi:hypothetical protein